MGFLSYWFVEGSKVKREALQSTYTKSSMQLSTSHNIILDTEMPSWIPGGKNMELKMPQVPSL